MSTRNRKGEQRRRAVAWLAIQGMCLAVAIWVYSSGAPVFISLAVIAAGLMFADRFMRVPGGVPVLVYHSVSEQQAWLPWSDQIAVTPNAFDRHLKLIRRWGFTVLRNSDFVTRRLGGASMPSKPVVIHLDDGYLDNWVAAAPLLARHGLPATIMVSLDFVEPGTTLRPNLADVEAGRRPPEALVWLGYMNWIEIAALEGSQLIEIEAHGVDHARVVTGPAFITQLNSENWRSLAWIQWAATPGNKSEWYLHQDPPCVPYGTDVRENAPALASRIWSADGLEGADEYAARVRSTLARSADVLEARIGRRPEVFCWPENAFTPEAHEIALALGYRATTGGRGENRPEEDPTVISRVHAGDRALGWRWGFADDLLLLAACRAFQGNYYWCFPLFAIHGLRKVLAPALRVAQRLKI